MNTTWPLNHTYEDAPILWRVPGTHTLLYIYLDPTKPIAKFALGQTILRTQQRLRSIISRDSAEDTPLRLSQDPYESDEIYQGCFFGVASWPVGSQLLTYGTVDEVLQGLWLYLYRGERFARAVFQVRNDQFGLVGIGKIQSNRPD